MDGVVIHAAVVVFGQDFQKGFSLRIAPSSDMDRSRLAETAGR